MSARPLPIETHPGTIRRLSVIHVPLRASARCRESMQHVHRLRGRLSIALGTAVATLAMVTVICMTAHLLD